MPNLKILSGLGQKGPACMRVHTGHQTWLLDCGAGPEAEAVFDPNWLDGVDAVLISHDHVDHIGGVAHVIDAGRPIYCTQVLKDRLDQKAQCHVLPEQGTTIIEGITVTTGRNGHSLGGVWFHLDIGGGLFYSGDYSLESFWFPFDLPPLAKTAIIDCSYHLYEVMQTQHKADLDTLLDHLEGTVLFPVPPSGRAGEMAVHLYHHSGPGAVSVDAECAAFMKRTLMAGMLKKEYAIVEEISARPFSPSARFLLCDTPNADGGAAFDLVSMWQDTGRLGIDAHVVFTGHMTQHARQIRRQDGGYFRRWNVHPARQDQARLLSLVKAERFAPVFCKNPEDYRGLEDFCCPFFHSETIEL